MQSAFDRSVGVSVVIDVFSEEIRQFKAYRSEGVEDLIWREDTYWIYLSNGIVDSLDFLVVDVKSDQTPIRTFSYFTSLDVII